MFKVHFGHLTLKVYTKGERVLRAEVIAHNTRDLRCRRAVTNFPAIVAQLKEILARFLDTLHGLNAAFVSDETLEHLPQPSYVGKTRVGGVDLNRARIRAVLTALLTLAPSPRGFSVRELDAKVQEITGQTPSAYGPRRAAYDLKKLRGKGWVAKVTGSRRYSLLPHALRAIAALIILRDKVLKPILAGITAPHLQSNSKPPSGIDAHYHSLRLEMHALLKDIGMAV